jgi:hypothetical protein
MKRAQCLLGVVCGMAFMAAWGTRQASATFLTVGNGGLQPMTLTIDGHTDSGALVGSILLSGNPSFYSVCADVNGTVYLGQTYEYNGPQTFAQVLGDNWNPNPYWGASQDAGDDAPALQNAAYLFQNYGQYLSKPDALTEKSALQLAVWESLYETTGVGLQVFDLAAGRFSASTYGSGNGSAAISLATSWLSGMTGDYGITGDMFVPVNTGAQEMLYFASPSPGPPDTPDTQGVPEPSPMLMGGLAMALFGLFGMKSFRKQRG